MRRHRLFISYRRDDTAGYARAIADHLALHFGHEAVFIDVDDIAPGEAFAALIHRELAASGVLLVLIGRRWAGERPDGGQRLDEPGDFVRREVAQGLASGAPVIPVLLDGAAMPGAAQLPPPLQRLSELNALAIDPTRFAADMQRLVQALNQRLGAPAEGAHAPDAASGPPSGPSAAPLSGAMPVPSGRASSATGPSRRPRPVLALAAAVLVTAAVATASFVALRSPTTEPPPTPPRPAINGSWQAQVHYPWLSQPLSERFELDGEGQALRGSAGFLRVRYPLRNGQVHPGGLRFETRSREVSSGQAERELRHTYEGRLSGDTLILTLQTEGGASPSGPVPILAQRVSGTGPATSGPGTAGSVGQ